jgi:hypothetical protein
MRYEQFFLDENETYLEIEKMTSEPFTSTRQLFDGVEIRTSSEGNQNKILLSSLTTGESLLILPAA